MVGFVPAFAEQAGNLQLPGQETLSAFTSGTVACAPRIYHRGQG